LGNKENEVRLTVKVRCFVFIVSLGISIPAFAKDPLVKCSKFSSTVEIFTCLDKTQEEVDASLNVTYQRFLKTLKKMEVDSLANMPKGLLVESLKNAQRAWIAYRVRSCDFDANLGYDGTAAETNRITCIVRMTKQRLDELDKQSTYWENH
jgi:uncharacterized protein YecT (DUF1311 family)